MSVKQKTTKPLGFHVKRICIVPHCEKLASEVLRLGHTVVTLQTHHTCLYLVSIHQMAPPLSSDCSVLL